MVKNSLTQTQTQIQTQTQTLSPPQVMYVRLLELTTVELEDKLRSEVIENPALEVIEAEHNPVSPTDKDEYGDEVNANSSDDYSSEDEIPDYNGWEYRKRGEIPEEIPYSADTSFGDTLLEQLGELPLDEKEKAIGEYIIGSLEEDGLLYKPLVEIEDELTIYYGMDTDMAQIEKVLGLIQTFDPPGIGARSLQECLLLQLNHAQDNATTDMQLHSIKLQKRIVTDCYDDFSKKHWDVLPGKLAVSEEECRRAISDITHLNPRPGASLAESLGTSRQQIIPDFIVDIHGDSISVQLNNMYVPELRVSDDYQRMLDEQMKCGNSESKAAAQFLKQKIDAAKGFISAVKQRENTLSDTMNAIVRLQAPFLLSGGDESLLKPMILDDVAQITNYDISTISRVSNSKYVQLPWGVYSLKYFFSDAVTMSDGGELSVRELHRCLQELIDNEDKSNPLTDTELMEKLQEQGFTMARRTVAKYREQLRIPVARLRKE